MSTWQYTVLARSHTVNLDPSLSWAKNNVSAGSEANTLILSMRYIIYKY